MATVKTRRLIMLGASVVMTAVLVPYLLRQSDPALIVQAIRGISPDWALAALILYGLNYVFKAMRFAVLLALPQGVTFSSLLWVVSLHNALNCILPARLGELSFIYLARREQSAPVSAGTAALVAARFFDLVALGTWLILATLLFHPRESLAGPGIRLVSLTLLLVLVATWWLVPGLLRGVERSLASLPLGRVGTRLIVFVRQVRHSLVALGSWRVYGITMLLSLGMWLGVFLIFYCLLQAIGLPVSLFDVVLGTALLSVGIALPVQGLLGFGTSEALWTVGFTLVGGMETSTAITAGFVIHGMILVYALGLGGLALLVSGLCTAWSTMWTSKRRGAS